ncbi:hypothetical protein NDU88_003030 [Pleurodeles waltl]|uniref:Uncharacterized protein n=1 Tax=Pleurodeles waltl TaxID=8319 RepID=A0AAV7SEM5_PLEWA|nr:hypothetical protein NDU88_003030 [Pleurodeles waltl]
MSIDEPPIRDWGERVAATPDNVVGFWSAAKSTIFLRLLVLVSPPLVNSWFAECRPGRPLHGSASSSDQPFRDRKQSTLDLRSYVPVKPL